MGGMLIWWLLGLGLIVGFVWVIASVAARSPNVPGPSAAELLRQRYVRGEIDREEYLRRLDDLRR